MRCNSLAAEASSSAKTRESGCRSLVVRSSISEGTSSSEVLVREAPTKAFYDADCIVEKLKCAKENRESIAKFGSG
jgi:hypothetical protein